MYLVLHEVNFANAFFACNQLFKTLTKDFNDLDTYLLKMLLLFSWAHVLLTSNKIISLLLLLSYTPFAVHLRKIYNHLRQQLKL